MRRKITSIACGFAAASILSLALTACDSDSPSAPTGGDEKSSAVESSDANSSGNDKPVSSEAAPESSSDVAESSSSLPENLSSSSLENQSSSGMFGTCIDMDRMCPKCVEIDGEPACLMTIVACNHCSEEGAVAPDCKGGPDYVCSNRLWTQIKSTCEHITDFDGMSAEGNCVGRNGEVVIDCVTEQQFKCVENFWKAKDIACPPGSDCDGDGIPDGIRRPDLEPCDTDTLLEFYGRIYQCVENKWVFLPPPGEKIVETASDVSAMHRGGPAVSPRVVKVENASGTITFRDDGVLVDDRCTFNGLDAELRGDTLFATILYPGCTTTGGSMGVITFTLGGSFADVKYIKYSDESKTKPVFEAEELLPCGNTSSCNTCGGDTDSLRVGC